MVRSRLRIIVTGMVGLYPLGGVAWDYLQYVVGFARRGHDVTYYENTWSWPYHPIHKTYTADPTYSVTHIDDFFTRYAPELRDNWHYVHLHESGFGMTPRSFDEIARSADVFLNVSGASLIPDNLSANCLKVFLDTDPGYNQIILSERLAWSENVDKWCATVDAHDQHFTYAENILGADCLIPRMHYDWKTTRMPIVLDLWTSAATTRPPQNAPWTTVMTWNTFKGKLIYNGVEYGSKGPEFDKLLELPRHLDVPLKVAVGGADAPLNRLASHGWLVVDGPAATVTPKSYQNAIVESRGEVSPAKQVYVAMRTGWFSCRSACYLASRRPVVVQDTGFTSMLPAGEGLLAFNTPAEAADAIRRAELDYDRHATAALNLAREHFESGKVLDQLLSDAT
jgi:hypothetical protein